MLMLDTYFHLSNDAETKVRIIGSLSKMSNFSTKSPENAETNALLIVDLA